MQRLLLIRAMCLLPLILAVFGCGGDPVSPVSEAPSVDATPSSSPSSPVVSPAPQPYVGAALDMLAALDHFGAPFDAEIWLQRQTPVEASGLAGGLVDLEAGVRDEAVKGFVGGRTLVLIETNQSNHMVVVTLLKWDSDQAAQRYVAAERLAMQAKDGNQGVEGATYVEVHEKDLAGFIAQKQLRDMFGPYPAHSAVVARGQMIVEVTFLAESKSDAALLEYARLLFDSLGVAAP